ncbi:class I SAM-dependent methyltransferase [Acidobacteriota bacterium]
MEIVRPFIRAASPKDALRFLFKLDNQLYSLQGQTSIRYNDGLHTKHRHINYHQFFIDHISPGEAVLDIGSGNGFLTHDMATRIEGIKVTGIEINEAKYKYALENFRSENLQFIHGDALSDLPNEHFAVVTLSNVLEHIEFRTKFLKKILEKIEPQKLILRVPMFERDWRVPLKKELGIDYRLDNNHFIEYTEEEFYTELHETGLKPIITEFRWSEIWCVAEPEKHKLEG